MPPPPESAELPENVSLLTVRAPESFQIAPPATAELLERSLLVTVRTPNEPIAPPVPAELPSRVVLLSVSVPPWLRIAPPQKSVLPFSIARWEIDEVTPELISKTRLASLP